DLLPSHPRATSGDRSRYADGSRPSDGWSTSRPSGSSDNGRAMLPYRPGGSSGFAEPRPGRSADPSAPSNRRSMDFYGDAARAPARAPQSMTPRPSPQYRSVPSMGSPAQRSPSHESRPSSSPPQAHGQRDKKH